MCPQGRHVTLTKTSVLDEQDVRFTSRPLFPSAKDPAVPFNRKLTAGFTTGLDVSEKR